MSDQDFPSRVTLCEDGVYRWSYDMDMIRNRYLLIVLLKVTGGVCAASWLCLMLLFINNMDSRIALLLAAIFLGIVALTAAGYYIAVAIMHGKYHLRFEMDEEAVQLIRKESTQRWMDLAAGAAMAVNRRAGNNLQSAAGSGLTWFNNVRGMKEWPQYDALNLRELTGANQIWIPHEDYAFVRDFIRERLPERARQPQRAGWGWRLRLSCLLSLAVNLAMFAVNYFSYQKTCRLLIALTDTSGIHAEQIAFAMRNSMTGYRGGGVLHYDSAVAAVFFAAFLLAFFLLLSLGDLLRKISRGK